MNMRSVFMLLGLGLQVLTFFFECVLVYLFGSIMCLLYGSIMCTYLGFSSIRSRC